MKKEIPPEVVEAMKNARRFLSWAAERITDKIYADELNRQGMAINFEAEADALDSLLSDYGYLAETEVTE